MGQSGKKLNEFLDREGGAVVVTVIDVQGSTPREAGAWMVVSADAIFGTIGGGQLEFMAIEEARRLLAGASEARTVTLDVPLGPEIGQCCGGRMELELRTVDETTRKELALRAAVEDQSRPHVYVFGGGHVGHALAAALALLPVRTIIVETREAELAGLPDGVETCLTPMPEQVVREAPLYSAFLILTHDHALDFLIAAEALKRSDPAYVGMIGSKTKKATFRSWYLKTAGGDEASFARLVSPIGGDQVRDKRPPVIAALAAAEVMTSLAQM